MKAAADISVGRQLFVDDFLVESSRGVSRHWNKPVKMDAPVLWPGIPGATPKTAKFASPGDPVNLVCATDGGLWWDPSRRRFRLWYQADWLGDLCYAESIDGLSWTFPDLGAVPGTNRVFARNALDSWCVVPNYAAADPYSDWKLYISPPANNGDYHPWLDGCDYFIESPAEARGGQPALAWRLHLVVGRRHALFAARHCRAFRRPFHHVLRPVPPGMGLFIARRPRRARPDTPPLHFARVRGRGVPLVLAGGDRP